VERRMRETNPGDKQFTKEAVMVLVKSIIRPEKVDNVLSSLMEAGFPAVTRISVVGRGKQRGIKIGEVT
jgi:nitrogen regulatory protein PII 1